MTKIRRQGKSKTERLVVVKAPAPMALAIAVNFRLMCLSDEGWYFVRRVHRSGTKDVFIVDRTKS